MKSATTTPASSPACFATTPNSHRISIGSSTGTRAAKGWKLEAGSWKLEAGSWKLEAGSWKLEKAWGGCHLTSTLALLGGSPPGGSMPRDPPCGNFLYRLKACADAPETRGTAFPAGD